MVTKTIGPLHFEDLEPHRFEDLVRNLLYDFRDWLALEPTGRAGSDDGYDARGWERLPANTRDVEEGTEEQDEQEPQTKIESRVWMIQCKREKRLGPADITKIITDYVDKANPPYGFLLVAPVTFSKRCYDAFRTAIRESGIEEGHLWGKAEIEDQLLQPKNDRILFAFMGVSLATKRRSRATDVRSAVTMKNRLLRALGGEFRREMHQPVLIRDINDDDYPYRNEVKDFEKNAPWREQIASEFHPLGLLVEARQHYAYVDREKKHFDFITSIDLVNRQSEQHRERDWQADKKVRDFHEHLPRRYRGIYKFRGLIAFKDLVIVDDKGDSAFGFPHLYVDFELGTDGQGGIGPFTGVSRSVELADGAEIDLRGGGFKRVKYFPESFPEIPKTRKLTGRKLEIDRGVIWNLSSSGAVIVDLDDRYGSLEPRDVIEGEPRRDGDSEPLWIEIIDVIFRTPAECLDAQLFSSKEELEARLKRKPKRGERVRFIEIRRIYSYSFVE